MIQIRQIPRQLLLILPLMLAIITTSTTSLSCTQEKAALNNTPIEGIIDIHAHIGEFQGFDLSLTSLLASMQDQKIQTAFISNIDGAAIPGRTADGDEVKINEETAQTAAKYPQLKPLAWAKPGAKGASADKIEPFLRDKHFYGIKFHPDFNRFAADDPAVLPYLKLCEKYHVPALFHCGYSSRSSAATIYKVARQFPNVAFVLYHMGFGDQHDEAIEVAHTAKSKKDALIYLETAQASADDIITAIKTVGVDRVIFGTDATYYGRHHYDIYLPILQQVKAAISPEDFQRFIHKNAIELFHLEENTKATPK